MTHLRDSSHLNYARDLIDYLKRQISQKHVYLTATGNGEAIWCMWLKEYIIPLMTNLMGYITNA